MAGVRMGGVERVKFVVREVCGPGVRAVHVQPAARVERDADRVPRRHAHDHLRKQEERKHEAEQGGAHGVGLTCNVSPHLCGRSSGCRP